VPDTILSAGRSGESEIANALGLRRIGGVQLGVGFRKVRCPMRSDFIELPDGSNEPSNILAG